MGERQVYLDYNATTPVLAAVKEAMLPYLDERFGNPSSGHRFGRQAREAVEIARARVAALIGASPEEILFTSGGTESNNLAIRGAAAAIAERAAVTGEPASISGAPAFPAAPGLVVTSAIEHPAVAGPCGFLEKSGWKVARLAVDDSGRVDPARAGETIGEETTLVTVMHANNETGVLQPIQQVSALARQRGAPVHTDAAQSVGKVPVQVDRLGVDLLSIAGHKLYAPKGVGALYIRRGTRISPVLLGAGHERGLRPGTENVPAIVGLGEACRIAAETLLQEMERVRGLRDLLWELIARAVPGLLLNGHPEQRLPNTLNIRFPGVRGGAVLDQCPRMAASTGSACHEGGETPSAVITAMGIGPGEALGSVRLSLGRPTTEDDVREAADELVEGWNRARRD
ncbi:MAG: cysteine desulfurase family protein [Spirochaetota bacterium]